jgi:hypothetical protein
MFLKDAIDYLRMLGEGILKIYLDSSHLHLFFSLLLNHFFKLDCLTQISDHHDYSELASTNWDFDLPDSDDSRLPFIKEWHHTEHLRFFIRVQHRQNFGQ